jgi:hypothetical protein
LVAATIFTIARSRFTSGWKKIFWTEIPFRVWASISFISLTFELIAYLLQVVTRCSISGVLSPVSCQMTVTTGMLICGKMSAGIDRIAVMPKNTIKSANT